MQYVIMPKQGLQMTEGTIIKWIKQPGDAVTAGEPLFEMETDKLTITIDAMVSGTLLSILRGEGETVPITENIAIIGEKGEQPAAAPFAKAATPAEAAPPAQPAAPAAVAPASPAPLRAPGQRVYISPRAKTLAQSLGIDYAKIPGSGPEGMIREADIQKHCLGADYTLIPDSRPETAPAPVRPATAPVPAEKPATQIALEEGDTLVPQTAMRRAIADKLLRSQMEAANATVRMQIDMFEAARLKEKLAQSGTKVSYNDLIVRAVCYALKRRPMMNSMLTADGVVLKKAIHVGVATATEKGLIVPVIKNAGKMALKEIHDATADLAARAREGQLKASEFTGSTFTISNLGMFGVQSGEAILNTPETGILMTGEIRETPVGLNGEIVLRPIMIVTLTYDHRVLDGAEAALFTGAFREALESPYLLL
jgi:pyruvate dehydrogenase E2 component (dihydrolipoamide acetyltransferase)